MKRCYYILVLVLLTISSNAQSFDKDMETVYKNFVNAGKIAYNIKYVLKASHDINSKIISENAGRYIKNNDRSISQYASQYTLSLPTEIVMVDKENKYIRIKKQSKKTATPPDFLAQFKEYNKSIEKVTKLTTNKKEVITYNVELKNIPFYGISRYEISINTKTFFMQQITMFYKKPLAKDPENNIAGNEVPRLEMIFYDFNNPKIYAESELNPSYYYIKESKKISPSINFKSYDVQEIF